MARANVMNDKQIHSASTKSAKPWMKGSFQVFTSGNKPITHPLHSIWIYICSVTGAVIVRLINPAKGPNQESFTHNLKGLYGNDATLTKYFIGEFIAGKGYDKLLNDTKTYNQHGYVFQVDESMDTKTFIKDVLVPAIIEVNTLSLISFIHFLFLSNNYHLIFTVGCLT